MSRSTNQESPHQRQYRSTISDLQGNPAIRTIPQLKKASSREELGAVSLLDVLDADGRPTFILDVSLPLVADDAPLEPVYCNPSLAREEGLLATLTGKGAAEHVFLTDNVQPYSRFKNWLFKIPLNSDDTMQGSAYMFDGFIWSVTSFQHYLLVSGVQGYVGWANGSGSARSQAQLSLSIDPREHREPKNFPQFQRDKEPTLPPHTSLAEQYTQTSSLSTAKHGPYDITLDPPPAAMSAHVRYFRSVDWAQTPLGPMPTWCPQLRSIVNMIMNNVHPAVLFWGKEVIMIYNEPYTELIAMLHPCIGASARVAAKDYWEHFQPIVDHINATGQALTQQDLPIFVDRHGFLEETYFDFQFVPILDGEGNISGYYQPLVETTKNNILERRVLSLVEVGSQTAKARSLGNYWEHVLNTLSINPKDAPFALLYSTEFQESTDLSSVSPFGSSFELELCTLIYRGSIAVSVNHAIAPSTIEFKQSSYFLIPHLIQAAKSRKPIYLQFDELDLPEDILTGIDWKGYQEPCRSIMICPILPTTGEQVQGFVIIGVNPRRPFDEDYQQFIHVMSRLLATSLASVVLFDEEMRQKENAIDQAARMQEQLLAELKITEKKFQRFAERSDVAIFISDAVGNYTYRNQRWYEIFTAAAGQNDLTGAWANLVFPEDISFCEEIFAKLVVDKAPVCFELRTSMQWTPPESLSPQPNEKEHFVWILCSAYPELGPNGELKEIVGNVTDISKLKWAEDVQKMRVDSALESKNQLENFIDTTSHEMRNPLSAIMQCADAIISSYTDSEGRVQMPPLATYSDILEQTLDAAQTISECAVHMKRIVDDILTISKIDSGLLVMTPIDVQVGSVVQHAVKMFESEAKAAGVILKFGMDQTFLDLGVDWVSLDPTRLLQILINLITNAVKFTRLEPTRFVSVSVAASSTEPSSVDGGIQYVYPKLASADVHLIEDWKRDATIYLQFSVKDTGRGLSNDEKANLFARFSQASPRTHIHYGGSGLGLFISRRLTEMQGGAIGLASQYKRGSTFSFYIKARQCSSTALRRGSIPQVHIEDVQHRPNVPEEINKLMLPQLLPPVRHHKALLQSSVPAPSFSHSDSPRFKEFTGTNSMPKKLYVLVVEDNLVNQKVLAKQLRNLGCVVNVANHGAEALEYIKQTKYWADQGTSGVSAHTSVHSSKSMRSSAHDLPLELSIILMDWEMPVMNGLIATEKIRIFERNHLLKAHIPVIGVTANVREQQVKRALDAGMDDVVGKPFKVVELLERMNVVVAGVAQAQVEIVKEGEG